VNEGRGFVISGSETEYESSDDQMAGSDQDCEVPVGWFRCIEFPGEQSLHRYRHFLLLFAGSQAVIRNVRTVFRCLCLFYRNWMRAISVEMVIVRKERSKRSMDGWDAIVSNEFEQVSVCSREEILCSYPGDSIIVGGSREVVLRTLVDRPRPAQSCNKTASQCVRTFLREWK